MPQNFSRRDVLLRSRSNAIVALSNPSIFVSLSESRTRDYPNHFADCELTEKVIDGKWVCVVLGGSCLYILWPETKVLTFVLVGGQSARIQLVGADGKALTEVQDSFHMGIR
jgi:hypothetical protein